MSEMDHELTHSASDQSIGSRSSLQHRITTDTKYACIPALKADAYPRDQDNLWNKEGHACSKAMRTPETAPTMYKGLSPVNV